MNNRRLLAVATAVAAVGSLTYLAPSPGVAAQTDRRSDTGAQSTERYVASSLGNGLARLVAEKAAGTSALTGGGGLRIDQSSLAVRDAQGRVLVDLTPRAGTDRAAYRRTAVKLGMVITATDAGLGTLEGYVPLSAVPELSALPDTGTLSQVLRPQLHAGSTTSQGVAFQRVDKVHQAGIDGSGMTIGVLSDSYDTASTDVFGDPLDDHAADDVASGDLPGVGNPDNPQPVVVVDEGPDDSTDEGRAMLQIVHDIAPAAKLCFAQAGEGQVGFANNIRALADKSGACGADVIVDDVGYGDETPYADNLISDAIDDVTADGVTYFSAAGNGGDHQAWSAPVHLVGKAAGTKGTNLDFKHVDPALYAGGLEDMDPGKGTDVGQTIDLVPSSGAQILVSWNDPVDVNGASVGDPYYENTGTLTDDNTEDGVTFDFTPTDDQLGNEVLLTTDGVPSASVDLILDLKKPDGTEIGPVDTGSSPERLATALDQPGTYTITVSGYDGATGDFTVDMSPVLAPSKVTTDFNLLIFDKSGNYLGVVGDDNTLSGRPQEALPIGGLSSFQMVIARATTGKTPVTQMSYQIWGDGYAGEYYSPKAVSIVGHPAARGAVAVAAYDPFKSYLPESYTSYGGKMPVYFDSAGDAYDAPEVRRKPDVASTDRGNTTFFVADDTRDKDDFPNFGGTSAAAPHAAAIAALVLEKAGGPGSLTPAQVRSRLEKSAFAHDLDPFQAHGSAKGLKITAVGDQSDERNLTPGSLASKSFFRVRYTGSKPLRSITLNGRTASPTSLQGLVFDPRKTAKPGNYRAGGFPFAVGSVSHGLTKRSISASFSGTSKKLPKGVFSTMRLHFRKPLHRGQSFTFGIDRDAAEWSPSLRAIEGNGADELGGAVAIPSGAKKTKGMRFTAVTVGGKRLSGHFVNKLGHGWTGVDGYGVVNAEEAVLGK
ncbi:S8 family serine peptidase [Nocardioides mangrovi]|uniref:S8 family serine peptidase n=1 Tax=Nocardioides mangrovi TaxID=2874580 RepID=A0ABS7UHY2_9ACTN|nr:S8 family serine peptidase [Nocardioides mangrovi]MBZ5740643.1 S8 family serine peptidase [Nocardioides mangrovi]